MKRTLKSVLYTMSDKTPHNSRWVIVTFNRPLMWTRNDDETWTFNPKHRYVLNANQLGNLGEFVDTISDLATSPNFNPLQAGRANLAGANILVERYRERGIGDLLFLTGPLNYLRFLSGSEVKVDMYALADRGAILANHPALYYKATLAGPLSYDDLPAYDYHWFVDTVTEYDEEPDQLNVYDALYRSLGLSPQDVPIEYKRPSLILDQNDEKNLDQFFYFTFLEKKLDLRKTGYYVVAPFARGSLRSGLYSTWLNVIEQLAKRRPVVVIGTLDGRIPETDMSGGVFNEQVNSLGTNVVNALRSPAMPIRMLASIISKATAVGCMDSGPLYVAQALNVPAISLWGPHDPRVRIGYDKRYMDLAIWNTDSCRRTPCYAYDRFPAAKCPLGDQQRVCEVLRTVEPGMILEKFEAVEKLNTVVAPQPTK